jgi:hypothetical protein
LKDLSAWFAREVVQVAAAAERSVLLQVSNSLEAFVRWAEKPILLWPTCNRVPEQGSKQKYFSYPPHIKQMAKAGGLTLDTRPNGPAVAAFRLAGGERPARFGSSNAWSIHHLYSGKFPYFGREQTMHAAKDVKHFTQSAGLIAAHPVADALVDEFPFFAWLLRAHAFLKFGYDPDGVFAQSWDDFGFKKGTQHSVIELPPNSTPQADAREAQHVVRAPRPRAAGRERYTATERV